MSKQQRRPNDSAEVRERAIRMVGEHARDYPSQWAAIVSTAAEIGCAEQTLTIGCAKPSAAARSAWEKHRRTALKNVISNRDSGGLCD